MASKLVRARRGLFKQMHHLLAQRGMCVGTVHTSESIEESEKNLQEKDDKAVPKAKTCRHGTIAEVATRAQCHCCAGPTQKIQ